MGSLIIGGVLLFGAYLFRYQLKILIRIFFNIFVKDIAKTPEGALAIFNEMIDKAQEEYSITYEAQMSITAQLTSELENKSRLEKEIKQMERQCELLVQDGKVENARYLSERRIDLIDQLNLSNETIEKLREIEHNAREVARVFENNLIKLKHEKQITLQELKLNTNLAKAYSSMDKLSKDPEAQKLLEAVGENAKYKAAMAQGAKAIYDMKATSLIQSQDDSNRKAMSDNFIDAIVAKNKEGSNTENNSVEKNGLADASSEFEDETNGFTEKKKKNKNKKD